MGVPRLASAVAWAVAPPCLHPVTVAGYGQARTHRAGAIRHAVLEPASKSLWRAALQPPASVVGWQRGSTLLLDNGIVMIVTSLGFYNPVHRKAAAPGC